MISPKYRKYDKLLVGILCGLLLPIAVYGIMLSLYDGLEDIGWIDAADPQSDFRSRTSALVAICLNILPLQWFKVRYMIRAMRGIVFPTFLFVVLWLIQFGPSVF